MKVYNKQNANLTFLRYEIYKNHIRSLREWLIWKSYIRTILSCFKTTSLFNLLPRNLIHN